MARYFTGLIYCLKLATLFRYVRVIPEAWENLLFSALVAATICNKELFKEVERSDFRITRSFAYCLILLKNKTQKIYLIHMLIRGGVF